MKIVYLLFFTSLTVLLAGCGTTKKIPYAVDAESIPAEVLNAVKDAPEPVAMPGDLLDITVTSYNLDAVRPFNRIDAIAQLSANMYNTS